MTIRGPRWIQAPPTPENS